MLSTPLPFFFFNDTATTEIYTLSLHDALPIYRQVPQRLQNLFRRRGWVTDQHGRPCHPWYEQLLADERIGLNARSEEHTSELQSLAYLVCRLLLGKKKLQHDLIRQQNP